MLFHRHANDRGATDPVLVIAAIATSLVLLAAGTFSVRNTVTAAARDAAQSALLQVRVAQETERQRTGSYTGDISSLNGVRGWPSDGALTGDGNCFAAFVSDTTGGYIFIDSGKSAPAPVPSPWPAVAPTGYPAGCFWPSKPSALTAVPVTNLVQNPTAATAPTADVNLGVANNAVLSSAPAPGVAGTGFKVTPNGTMSNDTALTFGDQTEGVLRLGMQPGHTYTASGTIVVPKTQESTALRAKRARGISFFSTMAVSYEQNSAQAPNKPGAYRVSMTFTVPAGSTTAFLRFYNGSDNPADPVIWTNLSLVESGSDHAYGDGNSPGWTWSGTPNKSTSSGPALGG